jgi:hypothetical protein
VPRFVPLAVTAALLCGGVAVATETTALASSGTAAGALRVTGQVHHPLKLTLADLAKYKQHTVKVTYTGGMPERVQHHTFSGPLLFDVLTKAGPTFGKAKNDALRWGILVTGSGNYRALISWAEILPANASTQILLAISEDGKPLTKPRTVLPGDRGGGRYVGDVATIKVFGA